MADLQIFAVLMLVIVVGVFLVVWACDGGWLVSMVDGADLMLVCGWFCVTCVCGRFVWFWWLPVAYRERAGVG